MVLEVVKTVDCYLTIRKNNINGTNNFVELIYWILYYNIKQYSLVQKLMCYTEEANFVYARCQKIITILIELMKVN